MSVSPEVLQQHWEYSVWATTRLLDAAGQLSPDELTRDFKTADNSVLDTLAHVFWSETIWLSRFKKVPSASRPEKGTQNLASLRQRWPALHDEWRRYLASVSDASEILTYKDLKGHEWHQPLWVLLFHIVNHSTHHRGQVSGFLRAMNHTPPPLDLVAYHREQIP
jgi:uncharacterized damage-inducible protein DinB